MTGWTAVEAFNEEWVSARTDPLESPAPPPER